MFQTISNFMRVGDIRRKIIFTLLMLIVFRIGTFIPVPNVNAEFFALQDQLSVFGVLNTFAGGALNNFSILAMGIMPYITASIIIQLLQMDVVPKFTEWSKQGEVGRRKLTQFTRYFTIVLGFIQALAMSYGFNNLAGGTLIENPGVGTYLIIAVVLTAGTAFLMWLGEEITTKGVGNGISIIIFAGIVAGVPTTVQQIYAQQFIDAGDDLFINIIIGYSNCYCHCCDSGRCNLCTTSIKKNSNPVCKTYDGRSSSCRRSIDSFTIKSKCSRCYPSYFCSFIYCNTKNDCILFSNKMM